MSAIVLDASKVNTYVVSNLLESKSNIDKAYSTSVTLKNKIPSTFYYKSTVSSLVNQIYNIQKKITDTKNLIVKKIDIARAIENKSNSKVANISMLAAQIGGTVVSSVTGAVTTKAVANTKKTTNTQTSSEKTEIEKTNGSIIGNFKTRWSEGRYLAAIGGVFYDTGAKAAKAVKSLWEKFSGKIKNVFNKAKNIAIKTWNNIKDTAAKVSKSVTSGLKKFGNKIADGFKWLGSKISSGYKTAINWLSEKANAVGEWISDKFNKAKDWVCQAAKDTGAWFCDVGESIWCGLKTAWNWITDVENWKRIGATFANMNISLTKGLISFIESGLDFGILVLSASNTLFTGLFDIISGISTGKWEWKATKGLWDKTKSVVAYNWTNKLSDAFYNTTAGQWLDEYAFAPFKSNALGCQICEGIGYVAGIVIVSIVTCGAGGFAAAGTSAMSVAMGATAAAAGTAKYTSEEWNKNGVSINYGGTDLELAIDYEKYTEIEKLKQGEFATIKTQYTDKNGNPIIFKIMKNGDSYVVEDGEGNVANYNGLVESDTLKGLAVGTVKGAWEGAQYYVGGQIGAGQFSAVTKNITNPILKTGAQSLIRVGLDVGTGVIEVPFQSAVTMLSEDKSWEEAWESQGGWKAVGTQAAIAGVSSFAGEAISFKGNLAAAEKNLNLNQISDKIDDIVTTPSVATGNSLGKRYNNYDDFLEHYDIKRQQFEASLTSREKTLFQNYCGEDWLASGNYKSVNGIARGNMIDYDLGTITVRGTGGNTMTYTFSQFESQFGETVEAFVERQTKASLKLNDALAKFSLDEDTMLYRGVNFDALQSYGIVQGDSAETIFKKLTNAGDTYVDDGFMSTAVVPTGITDGKPIVFELNCKAGTTGALAESFNPFGENEFLLTGGQRFSIDGVESVNGQIIVHMTSIL